MTSTLRFTPFVLKLPVRPPVLVAKQISSIAYLSDNRLGLGIGLSPWPEDFAALGVPWERRGKRMDECIDILRGLNSGEFFSYDGEFYQLPADEADARARPRRCRCSSAATSDAALRRAVLKGDGWMHAGGDGEELDRLLARLAEIRKAEGDTRDDFEVHVISYDAYDRRRHQAAARTRASPTASSASGCPTSRVRTPSRWRRRSRTSRSTPSRSSAKVNP